MSVRTQYIPTHTKIHADAFLRGKNQCAEPKFDTSHYISMTGHYMPINTTIHIRYIPIQDRFSTRVFALRESIGMYDMYWYAFYKYWHVFKTITGQYIKTITG